MAAGHENAIQKLKSEKKAHPTRGGEIRSLTLDLRSHPESPNVLAVGWHREARN